MGLEQKVVINQKQELNQQFALVQKIQISNILILSREKLLEKIQEEYINNPVLKLSEQSDEENRAVVKLESNYNKAHTAKSNRRINQEASDIQQNFIENGLAAPSSLQDHLLEQLHWQSLNSGELIIGTILISNLNDNGFYNELPEKLLENYDPVSVDKMIKMIRAFDPWGTCTGDPREALITQTALTPDPPEGAMELLQLYWDLFLKREVDKIRSKMNITQDDMSDILQFLKSLNPFPGASFNNAVPQYIVPDIIVKRKEGWFEISLNNDDFPALSIDPLYLKIKEKRKLNKEDKNFIKHNLSNAEFFISCLNYRNSNLLRVCKAIFEYQLDFFIRGPEMIAPLNLKDIAAEVDLDISTISRITRDKYIQTDRGVYSLKYFFANPVPSLKSGHREYSDITVLHIIKEILEKTEKKISDKEISAELLKKDICLDRRTVNKYRNRLLHELH